MKKIIKQIVFLFLTPFKKKGSNILMYHSVDINNAFFTVSPKEFKKQMIYLKSHYKIVPLINLIKDLNSKNSTEGCVSITFDDGYLDNYQNVFPVIKELSIPITIFIATNYIGKTLKTSDGLTLNVVKEDKLREMFETGLVSFMPHTHKHTILTNVNLEEAVQDIEISRKKIEQMFKTQADIFAYPKGKYSSEIVSYLKNNDWAGAVTVEEGVNGNDADKFLLKRNSIDSSTDFTQFKFKVSGAIERYAGLKKFLRI